MYIMGENPVITDPESKHVVKQLSNLDFLVVQDVFMNETGELAHVVLPASSFAEREGTYTNTERRVQSVNFAVPPPGDARPDWWIVGELAKRLGYEHLSYNSVHEITNEIAEVTPIYRGITSDRLKNSGSLQWPCPDESHPGTGVLHTKQFTRGLGKFTPVHYAPQVEEPTPDFPLVLTTGRVLHHFHSGTLTRRSPTLVEQGNEPYVEINPEVLTELNITNGEMVRVFSRRGSIKLMALASERVDLETVFIPFHFAEAAANVLTIRALDPLAKIPEYKACACRVEKIP
jgi:predicted molibdopterin-dependent oxidoreductase YjgC